MQFTRSNAISCQNGYYSGLLCGWHILCTYIHLWIYAHDRSSPSIQRSTALLAPTSHLLHICEPPPPLPPPPGPRNFHLISIPFLIRPSPPAPPCAARVRAPSPLVPPPTPPPPPSRLYPRACCLHLADAPPLCTLDPPTSSASWIWWTM